MVTLLWASEEVDTTTVFSGVCSKLPLDFISITPFLSPDRKCGSQQNTHIFDRQVETIKLLNLPPSILWFPQPADTTRPLQRKEEGEGTVLKKRRRKKRRIHSVLLFIQLFFGVFFTYWHPQHLTDVKTLRQQNQYVPHQFSVEPVQLEEKSITP